MTDGEFVLLPVTLDTLDAHLKIFREDMLALIAAHARDQAKLLNAILTTLTAIHLILEESHHNNISAERDSHGINQVRQSAPRRRQRAKKPQRRREMLIKFLKEDGSASRHDIIEKTGIPVGTVAYLLNDKTTFINEDGLWHLVKRERIDDAPPQDV